LHYAVELEHGTIIVLFSDENLDGGDVDISERQVEWLESVLRSADQERPIVLLMHRPLWRYEKAQWATRVHPMLVDHGVDAVLAGHFHSLHRDEDQDGVEYHLLGVCGGAIDQHPLTGQFNHLTLLDLGPGDDIHVRHLPSGVVLPDDFILREDQDRAHRLKAGRTVRVDGRLDDPLNGSTENTVELEVSNPIDVPITVHVDAARSPQPWLVDGHAFVARTETDIANPSTTDLETPFRLATVEPLEILPGATAIIPLRFTSERTPTPPPPPEIRVRLEFKDSQDRLVPLRLPRRIPITRTDPTPADGVPSWPVAAWSHSVYEEREPLGSVTTGISGEGSRSRLVIELSIHDDLIADDGLPIDATITSRRNPHGDLVVIELQTENGDRSYLFEPALPDGRDGTPSTGDLISYDGEELTGVHAGAITVRRPRDPGLHQFRIEIPELDPRSIRGLQIRVGDNDRTYHTQWRTLVPSRDHLDLQWPAP
jgi:hypothetical protein